MKLKDTIQKLQTNEACKLAYEKEQKKIADARESMRQIEIRAEQIKHEGENQLTLLDKWKV